MSSYKIKPYTLQKAKQLNVIVKPSTNPNKKIDVYNKNFEKIATIGDINYKDYPTYLEEDKDLAEERRKMYKIRHKNNLKSGNGYWANALLW